MGLDMYLQRKFYVQNWSFMEDKEKHFITIAKGNEPSTIPTDKIVFITTEEMRWRKANAIHQWFVDNVQEGADNCRNYDVSKEQLKDLLKLCKEIKEENSKAEELLPSQEGFFFGSYEYDEWYFDGINETIEIIERVLKIDEDWSFEYNSCW